MTSPVLPPGAPVEVRNGFTGSWIGGFVVESHRPDGYRLRRSSDGAVLPASFDESAVRSRTERGHGLAFGSGVGAPG